MTLNISRVSGTVGHRGKEKISMTRRRRKKKRKRRKKVCRWAMGVLPRQRGEDSALLLKSGTWHDSQNSRKEKEGDRTRRRKRGKKEDGRERKTVRVRGETLTWQTPQGFTPLWRWCWYSAGGFVTGWKMSEDSAETSWGRVNHPTLGCCLLVP